MKEKTLTLPQGTLHYWVADRHPAGAWLVFLPGLSADHHLFDRQMEFFARRYNCLTWDAPAHGASRPFPLTFTLEDTARWLEEIFRREGITRPVLVGQSLGGYIAQVYMALYPGRAAGFVSIDSCSLSRKYYSRWELYLLKHTYWIYRVIPWKLLLAWGVWGTAVTPYGRQLMARTWAAYDREEYCRLADHGFRIFARSVEARWEYPLHCPTLLLCGERDRAGSAKSYNRRWHKVDGWPLVWLKGAGHNSNTDAPRQVNRLIREFVAGLDL